MRKVKHYSSEQKVEALKRYFVKREEISKICEELQIPPTTFYGWQQKLFDNARVAFENDNKTQNKAYQEKITYLETKLQKRDSVVSELMQDHIELKKNLGIV
jgi:transposase-like protein